MKIAITLIGLSILIFSCKKATVNGPSIPSYIASITQYASKIRRVDSLKYDTSYNIAEIVHYDYDSSGSTPVLDTIPTVFAYMTDSTPPVTYSQSGFTHKLEYDGQNRVIKDSTEDGTANYTAFSYSNNCIVYYREVFIPSHSITVDSLFFTNGNITTVKSYNPSSGGVGTLGEDYEYGNYIDANPAYHPVITNTIGPLLHFMLYDYYYATTEADMLSHKMAGSLHATGTALSVDPAVFTSVIETDGQGRVVQSTPYYQGVLPVNGRIVYTYY
jgi:hypothetical protein